MSQTKIKHQLSPEEQWVIQCIAGHYNELKDTLNLEHIHSFAAKNGLSPYLFSQLKSSELVIPAELSSPLKKDYLSTFIRNTKILSLWKEVKKLFENNNLSPIPLKGLFLSTNIYPESALRPMSDMDILFFDDQAQKAYDILIEQGGICKEEEAGHDKKTGHHLPGIVYKGILIEIHRSLFDTDMQHQIPNSYIKKHLISINQSVTFTHELNFIYFSLHAWQTMRRGGIRLSWFLDLILLAQKQQINLSKFNQILQDLNLSEPILQIIAQTEYLFQHTFDFISDNIRKKLTQQEKDNFINLLHNSSQQDSNFSYSIAIERLRNTKGIRNKVTFLKSILSKDVHSPKERIQRICYLSVQLTKYILHSGKK